MAGHRERRPASAGAALKAVQSGSMRRLMRLILRHYGIALFLVFVCIVIAAAADAWGMLFLKRLIDDCILPMAQGAGARSAAVQGAAPDYTPLLRMLITMSAIYCCGTAASYLYNRIMVNVSQGTLRRIRTELFQHMEVLPIRYFDTHAHGDIMSVYTNDTDTLRQFIGQAFPQLVNSLCSIVSVFVGMCILNLPLTALSVCMTLAILVASGRIAALSGKYFGLQQRRLGAVNGFIEEMTGGAKVIQVFSHEAQSIRDFRALNRELCESSDRANTMANILMPVAAQLGNLSYVIVAVAGAAFAVTGKFHVTIGVLAAFLTLNRNFNRPFTQISTQLNAIAMAAAGADRIYALMDAPVEEDQGYVTLVNVREAADGTLTETAEHTGIWAWKHCHQAERSVEYVKLEGDILLEHVDFGYVPEKTVLHDISLCAKRGQKIAFVGSTGAGKTTITNLINRFYEIQSGKIRYDGINISKIKKADLRRSLGVVLQETNLFTGSVMENIRFGRLDASDEACIAAARLANADGFIRRLPDGYDTVLRGNGSNLSQGQRQLLSIARAAVADPPVLILDEATSSIDTRTEQLVQRGMDSLMKGRTSFVIAHRLSTVKNADCIMVMEQGRIIERGSHEELMAARGRYYRLYTGNSEGTGNMDS